ncbi:MAG: PASTA domain-containing protein [Thermodesulfobacteriota bacterium]
MMRIIRLILTAILFTLVIAFSAYFTIVLLIEGEETVVVPDLVGKDVVYCLELLTDLGLDIKVKDSQYSDTVPKHHVIDQYPEPGQEVKKGRDINLFLSKGEQYLQLPDLKGVVQEEARSILEANGLHPGIVSLTYHDRLGQNRVVAQEPQAGQMVPRTSTVNLLVSLGPRPTAYIMPDLNGVPYSSAVLLLGEAGLAIGDVSLAVDDQLPRNAVISHDPEPGARVAEGARVNLTINRPLENEPSPFLSGGGANLFRYRLENGFVNRHIKVILHCYGLSLPIIDGLMKPGEEVWVVVPSQRDATVFVYRDSELIITEVFSGG